MTAGDEFHELNGFQRDVLWALLQRTPCNGLEIKRAVEDRYGVTVNHGRLYPNLDDLAEAGWIQKEARKHDERTNEYRLTPKAEEALTERRIWQKKCMEGEL